MMNIEQACAAFKVLLEEQQARIANADETKKDFSTMETITVGIIDGDGIYIRICLSKNTVQAFFKISFHIVHGDDDADQRCHFICPSSVPARGS